MEAAAVVFLLLFLSFVVVGGVVTVRAARAVKRGAERASLQARRMVEETGLKARRYTLVGTAGELARLRLELRTAIDSTHEALSGRAASDPSLSEAVGLLARLNEHARALDGELKLIEREPDKARVAARLPELAERAQRITHSADSLRWAAQDRARQFADDDLAALNRQIEVEAGALRHWVPAEMPGTGQEEYKAGAPGVRAQEPGKSFGNGLGKGLGRGLGRGSGRGLGKADPAHNGGHAT